MNNPKDTGVSNSDPKPPAASKRTLAIVYALVVLAFAVGLVVTDGHMGRAAPAKPILNDISGR